MKKINLLVIVFVLSFVLSACGTEKPVVKVSENPKRNQPAEKLSPTQKVGDDVVGKNTGGDKAEVVESPELSADDWLTMKRPREKFSVKYPKNWYYVSNFAEAKKLGLEALIGFGDSSEVWEKNPPYDIEIISIKTSKVESFENYSVEVGTIGDNTFFIRANVKYKQFVDLMAESFKVIK